MKRKSGFLLIELMFSLVALSFMLCLFGQFFSSVAGWHRDARDRLNGALVIHNHIENMWYGNKLQMSVQKGNDKMVIRYIQMPLPIIDDDLILPKLTYGVMQYSKPNGSIVMQLPGYI
jgi:type II secretory pathway pseudopilin PulG